VSHSDKLDLLPSESPGSFPGGADILTCFVFFSVEGGGAASGGSQGCCGGCWERGTHPMSGGERGLGAALAST